MHLSLLSGILARYLNKHSHSWHLLSSIILENFGKFLPFNAHVSLFYQLSVIWTLQITQIFEKSKFLRIILSFLTKFVSWSGVCNVFTTHLWGRVKCRKAPEFCIDFCSLRFHFGGFRDSFSKLAPFKLSKVILRPLVWVAVFMIWQFTGI